MSDQVVTFASSIGLLITTRCTVACEHCIIGASPGRREEMAFEDADEWMRQAAAYRNGHIKSVVFTGGEPFYKISRLKRLLGSTERYSLVPAVVTNAYWAKTPAQAVRTLQNLPQIKMLTISTDQYHQKIIPFENVINAILAATEMGIKYNLAMCFEDENDPAYLELRNNVEAMTGKELIRTSVVFPAGRARRKGILDKLPMTKEPFPGVCDGADFSTIFPDGRVIGCFGLVSEIPDAHSLYLGSLREQTLAEILDKAESNVVLHILRVWGPGRLIELLTEAGFRHRLPEKYIKHGCCDLCYALISDHELLEALKKATSGIETTEKTAYARLYYMNEKAMLDMMKNRMD